MEIRTVTVEFLRAGPRHNQLLSPLTQYLGVCGDSPAGIVTLPYEHAAFERLRQDLQYKVRVEGDKMRRQGVLDQTGAEIAKILADVPGLPGAIPSGNAAEIIQLRIVLSASELALLPFELAKVPVGSGATSDRALLLQPQVPVCMTRHNRSVKSELVKWPERPRILFISGPDVPFDDHLNALRQAIQPWVGPGGKVDDWLTVLREATLQDVIEATNVADYTHVHILAHGSDLPDTRERPSGVALKDGVIAGSELSTALSSVNNRIHQPTVVTLATCDSAGGGSPVYIDASVANELHESGIPLVIASQFPLSIEASIPLVREFYADQMWGIHPLISMYRIRMLLHARFSQTYHDWASIVIYEALPADLKTQLYGVCYNQANAALDNTLVALETATRLNATDPANYPGLVSGVAGARAKLPQTGPYAAECAGLRAASWKRIAEVEYRLALAVEVADKRAHTQACLENLRKALSEYRGAAKGFLISNDEPIHRKATLHWLLGQVMALDAVLSDTFGVESWMTARFSADADLSRQIEWGHGTLAELFLLRLADRELNDTQFAGIAKEALRHAHSLVEHNGLGSQPVLSTRRQFERYVNWWASPEFAELTAGLGVPSKDHWRKPSGLVETAKAAIEIFGGAAQDVQPPPIPAAPAPPPVLTPQLPVSTEPKVLSARHSASGSLFRIEMIPSENGDCLWVEYGDADSPSRVMIDCGARSAAKLLQAKIGALPEDDRRFDLFALTHIDSDHIIGVLPFFDALPDKIAFEEIWFNGWNQMPKQQLNVRQGEEFTAALLADPKLKAVWNTRFGGKAAVVPVDGPLPAYELKGGMKITLLSPGLPQLEDLAKNWLDGLEELHPDKTKADFLKSAASRPQPVTDFENFPVKDLADKKSSRDKSVANGSSLALLLEFGGKAALLTGDAHPEVMAASIRRLLNQRGTGDRKLKLDALKLSHHGSANALNKELLSLIECSTYLVSTDGSKFFHPDRESIARVVLYGGEGPSLYFNYKTDLNELWGNDTLLRKYKYHANYPAEGTQGLAVTL